jgi:hypothetical protein
MATANIQYNLDDHDDQMAFNRAMKSTDMALALFEILYNTRRKVEHLPDSDALDAVFEIIHNELQSRDIDLDQLID